MGAAVGVPTAVLGASGWYREKHRPQLPPHHLQELSGATVVVTGATSGIGKAVASRLASLGATVVMGARDAGRGEAARQDIVSSNSAISAQQVKVLPLDLCDMKSVRAFAKECESHHPGTLSAIVSVAAEIVCEGGKVTAIGTDVAFATNHLGLQALVAELEPALLKSSSGIDRKRVVIVGSRLETKATVDPEVVEATGGAQLSSDYATRDPMMRYADTKRCNELLATALTERWRGKAVDVLTVTPGMVHTGLWRHFPLWYQALTYPVRAVALRSADDAAQGVVYAAAAVEAGGRSGACLSDGVEIEPSQGARDAKVAARLYEVCSQLIERAG